MSEFYSERKICLFFFSVVQEIYWKASKGDFFKALIQDHESLRFFLFIYRLQAEKEGDKGDFSPEALCDMPCSVPSTPNQPHVGNKTKTSFTIKWTVSLLKYFLFLIDTYI